MKAFNTQPSFLPHPPAFPAAFSAPNQVVGGKLVPVIGYPGVSMWQFMPPSAIDTSQDHVLRPPVAWVGRVFSFTGFAFAWEDSCVDFYEGCLSVLLPVRFSSLNWLNICFIEVPADQNQCRSCKISVLTNSGNLIYLLFSFSLGYCLFFSSYIVESFKDSNLELLVEIISALTN